MHDSLLSGKIAWLRIVLRGRVINVYVRQKEVFTFYQGIPPNCGRAHSRQKEEPQCGAVKMKKFVSWPLIILMGMLLLVSGCAAGGGGYSGYPQDNYFGYPDDRYYRYPYGSHYRSPYPYSSLPYSYPYRDYRYPYPPRYRDRHHHSFGRPGDFSHGRRPYHHRPHEQPWGR